MNSLWALLLVSFCFGSEDVHVGREDIATIEVPATGQEDELATIGAIDVKDKANLVLSTACTIQLSDRLRVNALINGIYEPQGILNSQPHYLNEDSDLNLYYSAQHNNWHISYTLGAPSAIAFASGDTKDSVINTTDWTVWSSDDGGWSGAVVLIECVEECNLEVIDPHNKIAKLKGIYDRQEGEKDGRPFYRHRDNSYYIWYSARSKNWQIGHTLEDTAAVAYASGVDSINADMTSFEWSIWTGEDWEPNPAMRTECEFLGKFNYSEPLRVAFWNKYDKPVRVYWDAPGDAEDADWGLLAPNKTQTSQSYHNHVWYAADPDTGEVLQYHAVRWEENWYYFADRVNRAKRFGAYRRKVKFQRDYLERTGRRWIAIYPRKPLSFHVWDPIEVGLIQEAETTAGFWHKEEKEDCEVGKDDIKRPEECIILYEPEPTPMTVKIESLSLEPRVFAVHNVMTEDEANLIIALVQGQLERSMVSTAGTVSDVRTSETAWLGYDENDVVRNIHHRIADILKIPREKVKWNASAEKLQIVRYNLTGEYQEHHDYFDPAADIKGHEGVLEGNDRLATFLFYLHEPEEGGETAFPLSTAGPEGVGIKKKMPKGSAVLFYSMLPDGNLDELSLHAGLPVEKGSKYIANLWIWEPTYGRNK